MTAGMSGPGNVIQCLHVAANGSNRGVLNTQIFASCHEASLNETITNYCADLMDHDNLVIVTEQPAVLKPLSKNFQG